MNHNRVERALGDFLHANHAAARVQVDGLQALDRVGANLVAQQPNDGLGVVEHGRFGLRLAGQALPQQESRLDGCRLRFTDAGDVLQLALERSTSPAYCCTSASAAGLPVILERSSALLACSSWLMSPPIRAIFAPARFLRNKPPFGGAG